MKTYILIIPIYNEAKRAPKNFFADLSKLDVQKIILVDDGSTDGSRSIIHSLLTQQNGVDWVVNEVNLGKAESMRRAMIKAVGNHGAVVITADADGAIEIDDIAKLIRYHKRGFFAQSVIISGARVKLAGNQINRTRLRHWIGRIVATIVNIMSSVDMYDPQSPLKIWDIENSQFLTALSYRFKTRWFYDVELIERLKECKDTEDPQLKLIELPIYHFKEVSGSKLKRRHVFKVLLELINLYLSIVRSRKYSANEETYR